MLLIIGTIRLPPTKLSDARPVMRRMVEQSLMEDGCEAYAYAEDVLEPGLIRVTEIWRDQTTLDRHFASPHLREWRSSWRALGIHDRKLQVYETDLPRET